MARQYSHVQFFRRVPNTLLGRYVRENHGVLEEIAFDRLGETEVEPIFRAFTALPSEQQARIEAERQDIDAMACHGGVTALIDEADFHRRGHAGHVRKLAQGLPRAETATPQHVRCLVFAADRVYPIDLSIILQRCA